VDVPSRSWSALAPRRARAHDRCSLSYRDDHDAAISRIDALEADAERDARKIALLEREIAKLRNADPPKRRSAPIIKTTVAIDELDRRPVVAAPAINRALLGALGACVVGIAAFAIAIARDDAKHQRPPMRDCTVQSEPPAELVGTVNGIETKLGITPVQLPFEQWREFERLQLEHDGYDDLGITVPRDAIACSGGHTYRLFRK